MNVAPSSKRRVGAAVVMNDLATNVGRECRVNESGNNRTREPQEQVMGLIAAGRHNGVHATCRQ